MVFASWATSWAPRPSAFSSRFGRLRACLTAAGLVLVWSAAACAQSVTIGSDRILRVNGVKLFPLGLVELGADVYPDWNQRIRDSRVNVVWDIGRAYRDSVPTCGAIRDSSVAAGYYMLIGSPDTWEWDDLDTPELEVAKPLYAADSLGAVNTCFPWWANHIGYVNRDEPEWAIPRGLVGDVDSIHVLATYSQIKAAEPSKVVAMNFGNAHLSSDIDEWKSDLSGYMPATNVVMSANYPYPAGPGTCGQYNVFGPACSMDRLWQAADVYRNELAPAKPLWMILQAHKGIPLKEARWAATESIVHGATGLFWAGWTWFHPLGDGSASWPTIEQVITEYAGLDEILVQSNVASVTSQETNVQVLGKVDPSDEYIVFAAARNGFVGNATINLPSNTHGHWVEVKYENRYVPITNRTITDHFDGYESHIYQVKSVGFEPPVDAPVAAAGPVTGLRLDVFPNPARGLVMARLTAPAVDGALVTVHDVAGRRVAEATVQEEGAEAALVRWDARMAGGTPAAAGLYFLRVRTPDGAGATARVVLR